MKYLAIIDARIFDKSEYAKKSWGQYTSCLDAVQQKISNFCMSVIVLGKQGDIKFTYEQSISDLYKILEKESKEFDSIFYVYADEPFLDSDLCLKMSKNHEKYRADFTFAEGYPSGLTPFIIHTRVIQLLHGLSDNQDWKNHVFLQRNFIFETIKKDINQFSIETEISPVDLRSLRIALNYGSKSSALISSRFLQKSANIAEKILSTIHENPDFLWGYPAFYNLQISSDYPQACSYCPYTQHPKYNTHTFMPLEQIDALLDKIVDFSEEAVIALSYMGEISLHPNFSQIIQKIIARPSLHLHLETSGIDWTDDMWQTLLTLDKKRTTMIITLDSHKPELYTQIRGEGFDIAMAFTERAITEYRENTWIQSVRQKNLEHELKNFYSYFEKKNAQVIIQKYNNFCNILPDEKPVNIAPLERNICWALQREITIHIDGKVNICSSDLNSNIPIGNIFNDNLETIWEKMNHYRIAHNRKEYPSICKNCDEYYVFNF